MNFNKRYLFLLLFCSGTFIACDSTEQSRDEVDLTDETKRMDIVAPNGEVSSTQALTVEEGAEQPTRLGKMTDENDGTFGVDDDYPFDNSSKSEEKLDQVRASSIENEENGYLSNGIKQATTDNYSTADTIVEVEGINYVSDGEAYQQKSYSNLNNDAGGK